MKVNATQYLEVYLSDNEIDNVFYSKFFKLTKWQKDYFIEDGKVKVIQDRHPRDWEETIRDATELDYLCEKFFDLVVDA